MKQKASPLANLKHAPHRAAANHFIVQNRLDIKKPERAKTCSGLNFNRLERRLFNQLPAQLLPGL